MTSMTSVRLALLCAGILLGGCGDRSIPDAGQLGPVRGQAAEVRDGIAFVPGTKRRYSGPLVTYYWNGDYVRAYYRNGIQHGPWTRYSKEHVVIQEVCFDLGVPVACQ
jgi:hypothetical protein